MPRNSDACFFNGPVHGGINLPGFVGRTEIINVKYGIVVIGNAFAKCIFTGFKAFVAIPVNIIVGGKSMIRPAGKRVLFG